MTQKLLSKSSSNRTTKDYKNNHVKRTPTCVLCKGTKQGNQVGLKLNIFYEDKMDGLQQHFACSAPNEYSIQDERDTYYSWHKADQKVKWITLSSLDNVLQHHNISMKTTYDIFLNFHEMFGSKGKLAKQTALRIIMNIKMSKGTPIKDHMTGMIRLFNKMKIFRTEIDGENKDDISLETLLDFFK